MSLRRGYTLPLVATLVVAAAARFWRLDLMEFKGDEANACRLALHVLGYSEPGVGRFFPTAGLVSSVGIPNPPLFVYLMAIPMAIVRSPIAAAAGVAAANVVAVWLTFVAGKRCFSRFVGIAAAALLALSPWGIVFSRKIWAQDLLPLCTALFVLQLHALLVERRRRAGFWLVVITAAATQLHFSAWVLAGVAAIALFFARRWVSWRWVGGGVVVAMLAYTPYLVYHLGGILHTAAHHRHAPPGPGIAQRFELSVHFMLRIVGGGGTAFLIGRTSPVGTVLSGVLAVAAVVGIVLAARRSGAQGRLGLVLAIWLALPLVALTVLPVRTYIHYFIILLPVPYLAVAYALERALPQRAAALALVVCLGCFVAVDAQFFRTIIRDGGAPGDYGIAYRYKRDAVASLERQNPGKTLVFAAEPARAARTYRFLVWNSHPSEPPPASRTTARYVFVDTWRHPNGSPLVASAAQGATRSRTSTQSALKPSRQVIFLPSS